VLFIAICLGLCIFLPRHRHIILVIASLSSVVLGRTNLNRELVSELLGSYGLSQHYSPVYFLLAVALVLFGCFLVVHISKPSSGRNWQLRRPVLTVIASYLFLASLAYYLPLSNQFKVCIWVFLLIFNNYLWFLSYSFCERHDPQAPTFIRQLGYYQPFWYPSSLPIPKGASYIRQIMAVTPEELAVCRLKGLKLLIWAIYLSIFTMFLEAVCYGFAESYSRLFALVVDQKTLIFFFREELVGRIDNWPLSLDIPYYKDAFESCIAGQPLPFGKNWQALILYFFLMVLHLAVVTHAAIAICRMAGYKALRNVYRPLRATTIAGFWNNYYYYYKELMVTVFFYPTFLRYFRNRPMLRYYVATMAAAGLGNFLYHFLLRIDLIITQGVFQTVVLMQSMLVYCFLLGNGIFLSQLRKLKRGNAGSLVPAPLATAGVLLFYCVISIFGDAESLNTLADSWMFFLSLFNLNLGRS
jgi:hypothetical protein